MRPPTLRDVAAAAGVHPGTASRALDPRQQGRISAELTERVRRAADELGYVVNPTARSLRTRRTGIVGVLVPDLTNPFFPPVLRGVEDVLREAGLEALIVNTDDDAEREARGLTLLRHRRCDGLLLATAHADDPAVVDLTAEPTPVVLINRLAAADVAAVVTDDALGIDEAVAHLAALGHRAVAHVAGPPHLSVSASRRAAFEAAVEAHLPGVEPVVEVAGAMTADAGEAACARLLAHSDERPVTAVLAANDMVALGCYAALARAGLDCPGDVSVVGINDMPLAGWLSPPLTTVAVPQYELGAAAARLLVMQIERGAADAGSSATLRTHLVVRGSTSAAPGSRLSPAARRRTT